MHAFQRLIHVVCILALLMASGCGRRTRSAPLEPENLALESPDRVQLAATFYAARGPNAPGLVLVHMPGADRHSWEPFALRAQRAGYNCLAVDLRGHGDSTTRNGQPLTYRSFSRDDWLAALQDIGAAKQALLDRGADPDNLALVGAGTGANLAIHYAVDHVDIQAVVLVSPGLDYEGISTEVEITAYGKRPALLLTAEDDSYSAASCGALKNAASGLCELRQYPGSVHGTDLLATSANAINQILLWLDPIIGPNLTADA